MSTNEQKRIELAREMDRARATIEEKVNRPHIEKPEDVSAVEELLKLSQKIFEIEDDLDDSPR